MNKEDVSVVIVDDMQFSRVLMKSYLTKAGLADIRIESSVRQALESIKSHPADVIVADWVMPEMTGLDLVDYIREQEKNDDHYTAVLLFTAREGVDALVEAFEHGVDDYLQKPINADELVARVMAAARHAYLQNQLHATAKELRESNRAYRMQTGMYDELTGLGNLASMYERMEPVLREIEEREGCVGIYLIHLENFAEVQAKVSSEEFASVIRALGSKLENLVRPTDFVSRISDDEFVICIRYPGGVHTLRSIIQRLDESLVKEAFSETGSDVKLQLASGCAIYSHGESHMSIDGLLAVSRELLACTQETDAQ